jgi:hypothetical protein
MQLPDLVRGRKPVRRLSGGRPRLAEKGQLTTELMIGQLGRLG